MSSLGFVSQIYNVLFECCTGFNPLFVFLNIVSLKSIMTGCPLLKCVMLPPKAGESDGGSWSGRWVADKSVG